MRILVTGGLGFVGSNLVEELVHDGHTITVVDNLSSESSSETYKHKYVKYYIEDIRNIDKLNLPKFEVIFHLAGLARIQPSFEVPIEYIDVNITGTAKICQLAKEHGARLIYSSSSSINNGEYKTPYTFSKWGGEEVLKTWIQCYNIDAMICRFYNVYGRREPQTGDYATVVQKFLTKYANNEPLTIVGDGEQRRDFTHVDDIVSGLIRVMEVGKSKSVYHLGRGINYSINELVAMFKTNNIQYVPLRKGEGEVTLANYEDTFNRLGWNAKHNIKDWIATNMKIIL